MTWITDASGWARFSDDRSPWRVRTAPDRPEAGLLFYRADAPEPGGDALGLPRLLPPGDHPFPPLAESYVRGNDLVASLPQTSATEFGLEICHRVIRSDSELIAIETIVAVQTDLLDSHPTIDLVCDATGRAIDDLIAPRGDARDGLLDSPSDAGRSTSVPPAATYFAEPRSSGSSVASPGASGATVVWLPPSDRAAAADLSAASSGATESAGGATRYRLLAEFLEKGVIRKARFWTARFAAPPSDQDIAQLYAQWMQIPLPLTP